MLSQPQFRCYVDESGDEGFQFGRGSSPWFFVSGVVVRQDDDAHVRGIVDEAIQTIWLDRHQKPPTLLHWRDLDHNKKIVVAKILATRPFCQVAVGVWKPGIRSSSHLTQADFLYRYAVRFLLERVTWYVADRKGRVQMTFSSRSRFNAELLRGYVARIMHEPATQVKRVLDLDEILVRDASQVKMLQVADACTSAVANAFNPDHYGNIHPYYLELIKNRLYCRGGNLSSYGLKLFPAGFPVKDYPFLSGLWRV